METVESIPLVPDNDESMIYVGSQLEGLEREEIIGCLRSYVDIFAWSPTDMLGIDPCIMEHHLNVRPGPRPIK